MVRIQPAVVCMAAFVAVPNGYHDSNYTAKYDIRRAMAVTFVKVKVANMANPRRSRRYEFLVDSGAVYTVLPEKELKKLGVEPTSEEEFTLANGETFKKAAGNALFEFEGKVRAAPVVFGEK